MSSNSSILADTTLAILAGGQSSRMGTPKSHLMIGKQPILQFILNRLNWPGPTLLVTAPGNEHPPAYERFDQEVTDPHPNQGPLRGLLTAFDHCSTGKLAVMPVDMPLITSNLFAWFASELKESGLMIRRGKRIEPLPMLLSTIARPRIQSLFDAGERSLVSLSRLPGFSALDAPSDWPAETWTNLNTPADFERFTRDPL